MATNPLAAAAAARKSKGSRPVTAKKPGPKRAATATRTRGNTPYEKIAAMYEAGKSTAEISDGLGLTKKKTVDGKENPYPYYTVVGALYKLSKGVKVGDKIIKIKRG